MPLTVLNVTTKGPITTVLLHLSPPEEERDGRKVEIVRSTDEHHRVSRELMKKLGYKWVGGNFIGEIWFVPKDRDMFKNGNILEVEVVYRYVVETVSTKIIKAPADDLAELVKPPTPRLVTPHPMRILTADEEASTHVLHVFKEGEQE